MSENNQNNNKKEPSLSEVLKVRRDKLAALCEAGEDPFVKTKYDVTDCSKNIKENFDALEGKTVSLGGRIIARRIMGKASFWDFATAREIFSFMSAKRRGRRGLRSI